jgi:hypothetical protein
MKILQAIPYNNKLIKKVEKNFTIIIPSKILDINLRNCIFKIRKFYPRIKILVILDMLKKNIKDTNLKFFKFNGNIASKRNFASKIATTLYLTFIDSDAFPENYWLNYVQEKFEKKNFDVIGGPNISFCENESQLIVAKARLLKFVTVNPIVKLKNAKNQFIDFMPACNFSIKRNLYLEIGGMNENVHTGEENKIFNYCKKNKLKVYFLNKSYVQHIERDIKHFFFQRITLGKSILDNVINSRQLMYLKYLLSYLPTFYLFLFIVIFFCKNLWKFYFFGLLVLVIIILVYAIKISEKNFFKSLIVILASVFGPGLGFIYSLLGFSFNKVYIQNKIKYVRN